MTGSLDGSVYACPACRQPVCPACRDAAAAANAACRACRQPGQECYACLGRGEIWVTPDVLEFPGSLRRVLIAIAEDGIGLPGASLLGGRVAYGATAGERPSSWRSGVKLKLRRKRPASPPAAAGTERAEPPPAGLATVTQLFPTVEPTARAAGDGRADPRRRR